MAIPKRGSLIPGRCTVGAPTEASQHEGPGIVRSPAVVCGIVAVDEHHHITAFNAEAEALTGLSAEAVLRQPWEILPKSLQTALQETAQTNAPILGNSIALPNPARGETTAWITTCRVTHPDGRLAAVIATLANCSPTLTPEQHSDQLDRLASIGTLSASMAHEIKNALVAVRTFVELLGKQNQETELARVAVGELKRIDSIVSQMLRFAGPAKPTFSAVPVHEILDHALRVIQHQVEGRRIQVQRTYLASLDTVNGDNYQLQQAFVNLFFNALEAMGANGELTVATEVVTPAPTPLSRFAAPQPQLQVRIIDNGVGVPPANLDKVFDPFFTTKPNGTGLGLSITRRIIQEHKGQIIVESQPRQGATFTITLPLAG